MTRKKKLFNVPINFGYGGGYSALIYANTVDEAAAIGEKLKAADDNRDPVMIYGEGGDPASICEIKFIDGVAYVAYYE